MAPTVPCVAVREVLPETYGDAMQYLMAMRRDKAVAREGVMVAGAGNELLFDRAMYRTESDGR